MLEFLLGNDFIAAVLAFALVLIPAIIIHELGHFLAAKAAGISVLEFGIGFPPKALKLFRWGETEFTLNWLPIGGFVRPLGEDMIGPSQQDAASSDNVEQDAKVGETDKAKREPDHFYLDEREELRRRGVADEDMMSVNDAKPVPRIVFMAAGAFANFVSAIGIFIVVALIGLPTVVGARAQLTEIPEGTAFAQAGVEVNDAIERIEGERFMTLFEFFERYEAAEGDEISLSMRRFEDNETYDIAITPQDTAINYYVEIVDITSGSPAEAAGLQADDLIAEVNGEPLPSGMSPIAYIQQIGNEYAGQEIHLTVLRGGEPIDATLTPRENPPPNTGRMGIVVRDRYIAANGVNFWPTNPQEELIPQAPGDAIAFGFRRTGEVVALLASIPNQLIEGAISPEEARPVSPVGISQIGGAFLQQSIRDNSPVLILNFIAIVSIALGVTNLLPIPPLDGGRIVFVLIEIVRGKPVSPYHEARINQIGFAIFLSIGVLIILYDIFNPITIPQ